MKITLASASPRRRELIAKIKNLTAEIYPSGADESRISARTPRELAENLALVKAESVFRDCGGIVLGADTVVALGGRVLGKPKTEAEAREFLRLLSGKTHEVITAARSEKFRALISMAILTRSDTTARNWDLRSRSLICSARSHRKRALRSRARVCSATSGEWTTRAKRERSTCTWLRSVIKSTRRAAAIVS